MKIRNLSKRQWVITSIVALVLIAALGAYFLLLRGSATVIPTSDYQVLKPKEFSSRVAVNGSVAPGKTANLYTHPTRPSAPAHGVAVGLVGDVVDVRPEPIIDLLDQGRIPVISSVAPLTTDSETVLNVNADTAAAAIAVALKARTLLMLTDVEGLYSAWPDRSTLVPFISAAALEELLPTLEAGMIPKMEACLRAVYGGVAQAHVVDGRQAHSMLLEIVTDQGVGTVIHPGDAPVPPLNGGKSL